MNARVGYRDWRIEFVVIFRDVRAVSTVVAIVLAALVAVSCQGGAAQDTNSLLTGVVVATSVPTDSVDDGDARRGGILILDTDDCGIFDPAIDLATAGGVPNLRLVNEIHSGLTRIGTNAPYLPEPELATSYEIRSGGTEWEFTLRPGLKFSDGNPLVSSDVRWSWERALRKSTPPSRAHEVLGSIVGAAEIANGSSNELTGLRLIDDQTFTVRLTVPRADFPLLVADPIASVVQPANAELWGDIWSNHEVDPSRSLVRASRLPTDLPVGAGPFRLVSYETPSRVLDGFDGENTCALQRNEHYWHPSKPYLDGVSANAHPNLFAPGNDSAPRQTATMQTGALDLAVSDATAEVPASGMTTDGFKIGLAPLGVNTRLLVFDPTVPPFDDINVRRALIVSVDLTRPANRFEDVPTYGLVPPDFVPNGSNATTLQYDADGAAAEFNSTDFANTGGGPALVRQLFSIGFIDPALQSVLDAWETVLGIDINSIGNEDADAMAGIADVSYSHASPSPAGVLAAVINAFQDDPARTEFAELQDMLDAAVAEADQVGRVAKFVELEQRMIDEAYVLPILMVETGKVLVTQPWVNDLTYPRFTGSVFSDVWFGDSAPERTLTTQ